MKENFDFYRSKRETKDHIEPLSVQVEKKVPRKKHLALQLTVNVVAYIVLFTMLGGLENILLLLGIMLASTAAQIVVEVILSKKDAELYHSYLKKVEKDVDQYLSDYKEYTESVLIPASKLSSIVSRRSSELYCKLPSHKDFLTVNLGKSAADYPIEITYPHFAYNEDNSLESFSKKMDKKINSKNTDILPFGVSLREHKSVAFINKGLTEDEFMSIINAAVMDVATFQSPEEVQMCFCFYSDIALDWACYLPHVWNGNRRLVFCDSEPENEFTTLLQKAIADKNKHIVAVVDVDFALDLKLYSIFNSENLPENLSVIFFSVDGVAPTRAEYVVECSKIKRELVGKHGERNILLNTLSDEESFNLARKLFNINLVDNHMISEKDMPDRLTFFELFGVKRASDLPKSNDKESINIQHCFPVVVGYGNDNEKTVLDLTNDGDGNHCLVTGTNGSGKSEFLLTYILSACAKYSPEYFSFVTIDFKGGLMSNKVSELPHCRGEFTNGHTTLREISRIAKLLESEINYREELLQQYGCNGSLSRYHELYQKGEVTTPLPRLLVVVDEVAVFFSEDPSAAQYITKIATVGRQLGIILLLSTQSKSGIIPSQVRTNINVCVDFYSEDGGIKAHSKIKGRAVINSNNKENYSCQVAISSIYDSNFAVLDYLTVSGKSRLLSKEERKQQLELICDELTSRYDRPAGLGSVITANLDMKYQENPLVLPDLKKLYYQDGGEQGYLPLGVSDNIFDREYDFFEYEPSKYNLLVYGAPQSGKTTFIKSLLVSMFDQDNGYRPSNMQVYIIAKNPQEYAGYTFPHVGSILPEGQMYYFLLFLVRMINARKKELSNAEYPHVTVVFDDCYESIKSDSLANLFKYITAESVKYRISVILTLSSAPGFTSTSLVSNFSSKIAFYMGSDYNYSSVLHIDAIKNVGEVPGRCLVDIAGENNLTLETQIAFPYSENESEVFELCENYCRLWQSKVIPPSVPLMPDVVSMPIDRHAHKIPVGYHEDLSVCYWDFEAVNTYLVSYFADGDAVHFVKYMLNALSHMDVDLIIMDNQRSVLANIRQNDNTHYFSFEEKDRFGELLAQKQNEEDPSRDTAIVVFDFAKLLGTSYSEVSENNFIGTVNELVRNKKHRCFFLFAEFKMWINNFRAASSSLALGATLEGANSGLLLGSTASEHTFGASSLPYSQQLAALHAGWGIHVSPIGGETKKIKFAVEVDDRE